VWDLIGALVMNRPRYLRITAAMLTLPRRASFGLATLVGWITYLAAPRAMKRIVDNLGEVFPDLSERERRRLCRRYVVHECLTIYEHAIEYRRALVGDAPGLFRFEGIEQVEEAMRAGKGAIVFGPHLGNVFYAYWALCQRYPCFTVVTAGSPQIRPLYQAFKDIGCPGVDYDDEPAMSVTLKLRTHLAKGGLVYLLGDFWRPTFPALPLFGKPSNAPLGGVALALRLDVPVVTFYTRRESWFRHVIHFDPPISLRERHGPHGVTAAAVEVSHAMEEAIRHTPEQWIYWFNLHERWAAAQRPAEAQPADHAVAVPV
jgi:KDO2-lipid IV(A) lauroyltransferase